MSLSKKPCGQVCLDEEQRQQLLAEQLPQVRYIAKRIHDRLPKHVPFEDLVHAGVVGLIDAFKKFDVRKHVQFGAYAKFRIRGAILDSLREMDWSPRDLRRQGRILEEAHDNLRLRLGRQPSEPELAAELHVSLKDLQKLLGQLDLLEVGTLRMISREDGREEDLSERLPGSQEGSPLVQCLRSEMKQMISRAMKDLPERERQVLLLYYFKELTMREIGAMMGIGESRVSQIHSTAVVRLRAQVAGTAAKDRAQKQRAAVAGV